MVVLDIDRLTYSYSGTESLALETVTFQVKSGEILALAGASGAGKSTLCRVLAGVIPHFYKGLLLGTVKVKGHETVESTLAELSCHIGYVMQNPASQLSGICFSVEEEVAFSLCNRGVEPGRIRSVVAEVLEVTGLAEYADSPPACLSGGQQQRLALASVLAMSPDILVLDEPTTFLDPQGAHKIYAILKSLTSSGKTVVIAEQRTELLAEYADNMIVLDGGRVLRSGSPEVLLADPLLPKLGVQRTRYTQVADLAVQSGMVCWQAELPVSLSDARLFFNHKKS